MMISHEPISSNQTSDHTGNSSTREAKATPQYVRMKWNETVEACHRGCTATDIDDVKQISSYDRFAEYCTQLTLRPEHGLTQDALLERLKPLTEPSITFLAVLDSCPGAGIVQTKIFWGHLCLVLKAAVEAPKLFSETLDMMVALGEELREFTAMNPDSGNSEICGDLVDLLAEVMTSWNKVLQFLRRNTLAPPTSQRYWNDLRQDFSSVCVRAGIYSKKIASRKDPLFQAQASLLRDLEYMSVVGDQESKAFSLPYDDSLFPCHYIPLNRNPNFFGRNKELCKIRDQLCDLTNRKLRTYALYGTGGIGKTQTALAFAYEQVDEKVPVVIWLDCETGLSLGRSFQETARMLRLPEHTEDENSDKNRFAVLSWLRKTAVDWVMIMDNVEDLILAQKAFPVASNGSVLVTSRYRTASTDLAYDGSLIDKFGEDDGAEFILRIVNYPRYVDEDRVAAKDLSRRLDGLALALTVMATQIKLRDISVPKFVRLYDKWYDKMRLSQETTGVFGYQHSLDTCWRAAFDFLRGCESGWYMLGVLSFISPDKIPEELFVLEEDEEDLPEQLKFCSEWGIEEAIKPLLDTSLVRRHPTNGLTIHRLIQEEFRKHLNPDMRRQCFKMASTLLFRKFPKHVNGLPMRKHWPECKRYIAHAMFLCRRWQEYKFPPNGEFDDFLMLSCSCGWYLMECGGWEEEAELMRTAMPLCENKEGLVYAHLANSLGCTEYERAHIEASRPFMNQSFDIRRNLLPSDHEEIANSLNNYANLILQEFRENAANMAYDMYQQVIEIDKTKPSEESCLVFHLPYINLGRALRVMNRYDESIEHNEKARSYMIAQLGPESHFDGLADYQNGSAYFDQGMYDLAELSYKRALRIFKKENELHPTSFFAEMKLAEIDMKKSRFAEAIDILKRVLVTAQLNEHNKGDKGEVARIERKLADAYSGYGDTKSSQQYHQAAERHRAECQGDRFKELPDCDQSYCLLVFHAYW